MVTLETTLSPAIVRQSIPELGPDVGIAMEVIFLLCHPDSKKPMTASALQDATGHPIFLCDETGEQGKPSEFWPFIMPQLGWRTVPKNARLRITVEDLTPPMDDSDTAKSDGE